MLRKLTGFFLLLTLVATISVAGCAYNPMKATESNKANAGQGAPLTIAVLDVGQGDAILIRTATQVILVDTGDVPARNKLVSYIKSQGISSIDKVIITHPHADHLGGMAAIMENFSVKQIYDSGQSTTTALYRQYLSTIQKKNIPFAVLTAGSEIDLKNGLVLKIFSPEKPFITNSELNNNSIVCKLMYGKFSMLLTGDAESEAEARMVQEYAGELRSTVLKSGHHGSNTSSSPAFLKAVSPETAIISLGANNDYHHPHPSTLKKYANLKMSVYRTDTDGTVMVTSDGNSYNIAKEK